MAVVLGEFVLALALVGVGALLFAGPLVDAGRQVSAYSTTLSGGEEEPGENDPGSGFATIVLDPGGRQIRYHIIASGVRSGAEARIQEASSGKTRPLVVGLQPLSDGTSAGCVRATPTLIDEISRNRSRFFVNVYDSSHPDVVLKGHL